MFTWIVCRVIYASSLILMDFFRGFLTVMAVRWQRQQEKQTSTYG